MNPECVSQQLRIQNRFALIPFVQQEGPQKLHTINLHIDFPPTRAYEGKVVPCCNAPMRKTIREHVFDWGDTHRLECVVQNTPAFECGCGVYLEPDIARPIKDKARAIRRYFEFQREADLRVLKAFLPCDDVAKVRDFAEYLRTEPYFISEGRYNEESPSSISDSSML